MAEIFRFTPEGGEEARNNREKDREREETERLLWEAGFAADSEFEFRTLGYRTSIVRAVLLE